MRFLYRKPLNNFLAKYNNYCRAGCEKCVLGALSKHIKGRATVALQRGNKTLAVVKL
jgi:hypothetical protein